MARDRSDDLFVLQENTMIAKNTYRAVFEGNTKRNVAPGQFVNIKIDGFYLRRPISVADYDSNTMTLIYKVVGSGTAALSAAKPGDVFDILTGLGNGYTIKGEKPLLIGGGVGVPPLYGLAKRLAKRGIKAVVILGFGSADEVFLAEEFAELGHEVRITTIDGSAGTKGLVTDVIADIDYDYFYTCGPELMLKAVFNATNTNGQFSFEERMGCGFGACMGCSCQTVTGSRRICTEGPVLEKSDLLW